MKLQTIFFLTGIAAGLMAVSCQSTADEDAEAFFGRPAPNKAKAESEADKKASSDYYSMVNAHLDRRLDEFNEKEEAKLPVFSSKDAKDEFMELSFIKNAEQISLLSMDFTRHSDYTTLSFVFDRESRTFTRTVGDTTETFTFAPFTNGVKPDIPYDAHILYAFATDFSRIAKTVKLRCYDKLDKGENPAIAELANAANIDEKGRKIDKDFVEFETKVIPEAIEFFIDNRWCHCYDVELKSICAPAVSMSLFVSILEETVSRIDLTFDDGSVASFIMDWREQNGIVLPRVIRRIGDNPDSFTRGDTTVILKKDRAGMGAPAEVEAGTAGEEEETVEPPVDSEGEEAIDGEAGIDEETEEDSVVDGEEAEEDVFDDSGDEADSELEDGDGESSEVEEELEEESFDDLSGEIISGEEDEDFEEE